MKTKNKIRKLIKEQVKSLIEAFDANKIKDDLKKLTTKKDLPGFGPTTMVDDGIRSDLVGIVLPSLEKANAPEELIKNLETLSNKYNTDQGVSLAQQPDEVKNAITYLTGDEAQKAVDQIGDVTGGHAAALKKGADTLGGSTEKIYTATAFPDGLKDSDWYKKAVEDGWKFISKNRLTPDQEAIAKNLPTKSDGTALEEMKKSSLKEMAIKLGYLKEYVVGGKGPSRHFQTPENEEKLLYLISKYIEDPNDAENVLMRFLDDEGARRPDVNAPGFPKEFLDLVNNEILGFPKYIGGGIDNATIEYKGKTYTNVYFEQDDANPGDYAGHVSMPIYSYIAKVGDITFSVNVMDDEHTKEPDWDELEADGGINEDDIILGFEDGSGDVVDGISKKGIERLKPKSKVKSIYNLDTGQQMKGD